ncbi:major histocompatibility complex class I-related gene protein-like isoform X2 [Xyrichtys novacula]|uniref:Major histocompatibility complex class I-related gene protein-like isoform X2 n=1 Tax=Xyrichtys novacula TaxID=13765 RepID=A0AAV1HAD5_XYRNO|nr:major histocompatibility complex class I-related gene protein-like isoform X2 [Xyrichtys novacula]
MKTAKPTQDWARELIKNDPQHLEWYTIECFGIQHHLHVKTDELERQFNQSTGVHILQRINGCEWDDETGETFGFIKYGFDREDLLDLDLQTMTWIAPAYKAFVVKLNWVTEKARLRAYNHFHNYMCPQLLKKYVHFGGSLIRRTELPSVSLLQKSPSSPVICHATGFYPDRVMMFWTRDGEELFEETDYREILPNPDGTFQMSVELSISLVKTEDWGRYECVFQLSGVKEDIVTKLDKAAIRSNKGTRTRSKNIIS